MYRLQWSASCCRRSPSFWSLAGEDFWSPVSCWSCLKSLHLTSFYLYLNVSTLDVIKSPKNRNRKKKNKKTVSLRWQSTRGKWWLTHWASLLRWYNLRLGTPQNGPLRVDHVPGNVEGADLARATWSVGPFSHGAFQMVSLMHCRSVQCTWSTDCRYAANILQWYCRRTWVGRFHNEKWLRVLMEMIFCRPPSSMAFGRPL